MEITKRICSIVATHIAGEIQIDDVCEHPNNGYAYIYGIGHLEYARENNYKRVNIHLINHTPYKNGDYVVEDGPQLYGPVEEGDRTWLEGAKKVVATTDKELGLPLIPVNFLKNIGNIKSLDRVVVDTTKIYDDGMGWKYALLPSEWNDNVKSIEVLVTNDDNEINISSPNMCYDLDVLKEAFETFAFAGPSDMPYDRQELDKMFDEFIIQHHRN